MFSVTEGDRVSLPLNPAGFMLIGSDMKLNSPSSLVGQALTEILQHPERARDALRVLLHLVRERKKGNVATAGGPGGTCCSLCRCEIVCICT